MDIINVQVENSEGGPQVVRQSKPNKAIAIRFKIIIDSTIVKDKVVYTFKKKKDENGDDTEEDAEYYSFSGSKVLINQATIDFTRQDLPSPTVIQEFKTKDGKTFVKFT